MPWKGTSSLLSSLPITNSGSSWTPALVMKGAECKRFGWELFSLYCSTLHPAVSMATGACSRVSRVEGLHLIVFLVRKVWSRCPLPFFSSDWAQPGDMQRQMPETTVQDPNCGSHWRHRRMGPKTLGKVVEDQKLSHRPLSCLPWLPGLLGFEGQWDERDHLDTCPSWFCSKKCDSLGKAGELPERTLHEDLE